MHSRSVLVIDLKTHKVVGFNEATLTQIQSRMDSFYTGNVTTVFSIPFDARKLFIPGQPVTFAHCLLVEPLEQPDR